jgi:hypothetical protein
MTMAVVAPDKHSSYADRTAAHSLQCCNLEYLSVRRSTHDLLPVLAGPGVSLRAASGSVDTDGGVGAEWERGTKEGGGAPEV